MSVKVQKNGFLILENSAIKLEKVPESALMLTNYRNIPKGLSQNGGIKEAGFYDGDARQQENCLPKPKELTSLKLVSSSMA